MNPYERQKLITEGTLAIRAVLYDVLKEAADTNEGGLNRIAILRRAQFPDAFGEEGVNASPWHTVRYFLDLMARDGEVVNLNIGHGADSWKLASR